MYRCAVVLAFLFGTSAVAVSTTTDLMVSGQQDIATVDANENGMIGDDGDCVFGAQVGGNGDITVNGMQDDSPNPLRACQGPCMGYAALDSDAAAAVITECYWDEFSPSAPYVPACMEFGSSVPSSGSFCSIEGTAAGGAQGEVNGQVELQAGRLFYPGFEFLIPDPGFGFLCDAGGPAVEVSTVSGRRVVTDLTMTGDSQKYACVNMPFQLIDGSMKMLDACAPVTANGDITYALGSGDPFARTRLTGLISCGGRNAAPTMSDLGLVTAALALLGVGAWALGRRGGFAASLPL